jgi:hypothetical protein
MLAMKSMQILWGVAQVEMTLVEVIQTETDQEEEEVALVVVTQMETDLAVMTLAQITRKKGLMENQTCH